MGAELMQVLQKLGPEGKVLMEKLLSRGKEAGMGAARGAGLMNKSNMGLTKRGIGAAAGAGGAAAGGLGGLSLAALMGDDDEDDDKHLGI